MRYQNFFVQKKSPVLAFGSILLLTLGGVGIALFLGLHPGVASAQEPFLVKDIYQGTSGSFPGSLINVNGTLFFRANDGIHGYELWKNDGSAIGTVLVEDIRGGPGSSNPESLTNVNGTLFFIAENIKGEELWQSDGTLAGTVLVKDINPGTGGRRPGWLTNVNGTLFFAADDGVTSSELWQSDGTEAGTVLIKDINKSINKGGNSSPGFLTDVNSTFFFAAYASINGRELWQSDGSEAGTVLVKDINPGQEDSRPSSLTNVNGTLIFCADDGSNGREFWALTIATSVKTVDILPSAFELGQNYPNPFNPETVIHYQFPQESQVRLSIYNVLGQEILTLVDEKKEAGFYDVTWNGQDNAGIQVASGIYLYRIQAGNFVEAKKLMLLR